MQSVPAKSAEQQALTVLIKTRALFICQRTKAFRLRGHLGEFGIVTGIGTARLHRSVNELRAGAIDGIPSVVRDAILAIYEEIEALDTKIARFEKDLALLSNQEDDTRRLFVAGSDAHSAEQRWKKPSRADLKTRESHSKGFVFVCGMSLVQQAKAKREAQKHGCRGQPNGGFQGCRCRGSEQDRQSCMGLVESWRYISSIVASQNCSFVVRKVGKPISVSAHKR